MSELVSVIEKHQCVERIDQRQSITTIVIRAFATEHDCVNIIRLFECDWYQISAPEGLQLVERECVLHVCIICMPEHVSYFVTIRSNRKWSQSVIFDL